MTDRSKVAVRDPDRIVDVFVSAAATDHVGYPVVCPDGTFTCDHGALVIAAVCDLFDVDRVVQVGTYLHIDPVVRLDSLWYPGFAASLPERERARLFAAVRGEHHHWVVGWPGTEAATLFDPNGPLRHEPWAQPAAGCADRYLPFPVRHPERAAVIDPDLSPWETASREAAAGDDTLVRVLQHLVNQTVGSSDSVDVRRSGPESFSDVGP